MKLPGCAVLAGLVFAFSAGAIEFQRDIRPILSDTCFQCHGPDEATRAAGLRLDSFDDATALLRSGNRAIVPGDPDASELWRRITAEDPLDQMPPPEIGKSISESGKAAIRAWIAQGAEYQPHWAFTPPAPPAIPEVRNLAWPRNPIDNFILARLEAEGLEPAPEADRATLLRRVSLDLTGLPPTPEETAAFESDTRPLAYERAVQRLLDSPAYGERFARVWLDLARYADTKGFEADRPRTIWRYRDWVIEALNQDMPYDQFTIEQMAGDLLPDATMEQRLATAFHRNTMTNDEGGTDDEEFRVAAVVDRVNTTMTVWMGLTMACAQCHTHKYDPITHEEYFQVFSIFNQTEDADAYPIETPVMPTPTREQAQELALYDERLAQIRAHILQGADGRTEERRAWEEDLLARANDLPEAGPWKRTDYYVEANFDVAFAAEYPPETDPDSEEIAWHLEPDWRDGEVIPLGAELGAIYLARSITVPGRRDITVSLGSDDGVKLWLNGRKLHENKVYRRAVPDQDRVRLRLLSGENRLLMKIVNVGGDSGFYFRMESGAATPEVIAALREPERGEEAEAVLREAFAASRDELEPLVAERDALQQEREAVAASVPETPILRELPPEQHRATHVHIRGNFLEHGPEVEPGVPGIFHPLPREMPPDRLAFAHWLMDEANPLTARVAANRHWEIFFGIGLVDTSEDFGLQGALPSHPELLDWLAIHFRESGWSLKELARVIVSSAAYRQSSASAPALREIDPYNRLVARGPRFRLEAEAIRDQALFASGLLSPKMYGPSVMPMQPEGIWQVVYSGEQWVLSEGEDRYRRGLYTYYRRTSPYPSMLTFDAPTREVCTVRRINTNTPLQAMAALNDPVYIEAAQSLARRAAAEGGATPAERAAFAFQAALARAPAPKEIATLTQLFASEKAHYRERPEEARIMAEDPLGPLPDGWDPAEFAAWTVVCNVILNLDELLMRI